jgi:hypothetical protein
MIRKESKPHITISLQMPSKAPPTNHHGEGITPTMQHKLSWATCHSAIYGLGLLCHTSTYGGDQAVVLPKFDFIQFLKMIERFKIYELFLVPPIMLLVTKNLGGCATKVRSHQSQISLHWSGAFRHGVGDGSVISIPGLRYSLSVWFGREHHCCIFDIAC